MGIETAALVMMGAGMGAQAIGAANSSRAAKMAYDAQATINRNNAQIAQWQGEDAIRRGDQAAVGVRTKANQLKGMQRAALAANGVDLGTGSALNILADTDYFKEVDTNTVHDNAAREAWALRNQAAGYTSDANLLQNRADAESPDAAAATSLITGAGRVASAWYTPAGAKGTA